MFTADSVALPGLAALSLGFLLFVVALLAARRGRSVDAAEAGAKRSGLSALGIAVQGLGIAAVGFGAQRVTLDPLSTEAIGEAIAIAALMLAAVGLFVWASRTMGRNWSIVARTRADHRLVQEGPFRHVRHPIYVAIFLLMPAMAIALGHTRQLAIGVPLYAIGTWVRVRVEETMLRSMFGGAYDGYAARVKRFVPGLL